MQEITKEIWEDKYRFGDEKDIPATRNRVIDGVYANDPNEEAREEARRLIHKQYILPAGRIHAGAGTNKRVTLINCFVSPFVQDSMDTIPYEPGKGLMDALKDGALTQQMGGGIGTDYSFVRPSGALVKRTGSVSTGVLPFMDMWNAMCHTIKSSGSRRGAMMGTLAIWHPDVIDFIKAKQDGSRLRNFNVSVLVSDSFMKAVDEDADWDLCFTVPRADGQHVAIYPHPDDDGVAAYVYQRVKARWLWDQIIESTYVYAEPGVIFIDRVNEANNLAYCEYIHCTNPCVTADAWVQTHFGPRQVSDLVGCQFNAIVDGTPYLSAAPGFFSTGRKPVVKLVTKEGYSLRLTPDHLVRAVSMRGRYFLSFRWEKAGELIPGDKIVIHDHRMSETWGGPHSEEEGYLLGLLVGDGTLKEDKAVLSVWPDDGVNGIMDAAVEACETLPRRADFAGWMEVEGREELRLSLAAIRHLALDLGMTPGNKAITPTLERQSSYFYCGFLRGLFDTDGTALGSQEKGISIRLAQSNIARLESVQRMLLRLGIASTIYRDRRPAGERLLPDGAGGKKLYQCNADHELVISGSNIIVFAEKIGFRHTAKKSKLDTLIASYKRTPNRERFVVEVASVEPDGEADVYDVIIPGINAFDANGLYVHNCGEQPLPPNGDCNLGHVNLAEMVIDPFGIKYPPMFDWLILEQSVKSMVRLLDNVLDITQFPTEDQRLEAMAKRRIGLGYTGLANALQQLGIRYGSPEAIEFTRAVGATIRNAAYAASIELAKERGPFPMFDAEQFCERPFIKKLPDDLQAGIREHGIRNGVLLTIAPVGTGSMLLGNVSSGIEPVFSHSYDRKVLQEDGSFKTYNTVYDYGYLKYSQLLSAYLDPLPDYFVTAKDLTVREHLEMQAAAQEFVDASISKTINCPTEMSFEDFREVYSLAYKMGLKGCTTYRPDPRSGRGAILTEKSPSGNNEVSTSVDKTEMLPSGDILPPPGNKQVYIAPMQDICDGRRYRIKWPGTDAAFYLQINDYIDPHGVRRPFELFINTKAVQHEQWIKGLTRSISAIFRRGGDVSFLSEELREVYSPDGAGVFYQGKHVPSLVAMIGIKIEEHLKWLGLIPKESEEEVSWAALGKAIVASTGKVCARCSAPAVVMSEGCRKCMSCGSSDCG